nr:zinc finger, C2H2 [Tanacetum cinerariifolium]
MDLKPLVPPQVPVYESQTLVDRKRKVEACYAQCSQILLPSTSSRSSARFVCVVCNVAFADVLNLKMHSETNLHKIKVFQSRKMDHGHGHGPSSNPFLCELCDIMCSSCLVMQFHVNGLKHSAYLREFEHAKRARILGKLGFY